MSENLTLTLLNPNRPDEDFPPVELAWDSPNGLLAVGGDLSIKRLVNAYRHGIFPWFGPQEPIYWWCPNPRAVLFPHKIRITRSLRKAIRNKGYTITINKAFNRVIAACAAPRSYAKETWISPEMQQAYTSLHEQKRAHSIEVWNAHQELVGGLYGVANGGIFCGESMFSRETDTSKMAFVALAYALQRWGFRLIDCQMQNEHLFSMGAENIPRTKFIHWLQTCRTEPKASWQVEFTMMELSQWQPSATSSGTT